MDESNEWITFTDIMMAFCLILLVMLLALWISRPDDILDRLIENGQSVVDQDIKSRIDNTQIEDSLDICSLDRYRQIITLDEKILFKLGDYQLSTEGKDTLKILAEAFREFIEIGFYDRDRSAAFFTRINILGHTDDSKVSDDDDFVRSNWDLSSLRAASALHFLHSSEESRIPEDMMSVSGLAHTQPPRRSCEDSKECCEDSDKAAKTDDAQKRRIEIELIYSRQKIEEARKNFQKSSGQD